MEHTTIVGIDPGPTASGVVLLHYFDSGRFSVVSCGHRRNIEVLQQVIQAAVPPEVLALEWVTTYGNVVGSDVLDTARWVGRFQQAHYQQVNTSISQCLITNPDAKLLLCGKRNATNPQAYAAVRGITGVMHGIDPGLSSVKGKKANPGPLYGVGGDHVWSALVVAVAFCWSKLGLKDRYASRLAAS